MPNYWFPAKRYGWGWGLPSAWQGRAVLIGFILLIVCGAFFFPPGRELIAYLIYVFVLTAVLIVVCWIKGEPPGWRWGDRV
jgi:hypothetical protein